MRIESVGGDTNLTVVPPQLIEEELEISRRKKAACKTCIFIDGTPCVPSYNFKLCRSCPYGYIYCFGAIVSNVYKKIIGLAINMFNREGRI